MNQKTFTSQPSIIMLQKFTLLLVTICITQSLWSQRNYQATLSIEDERLNIKIDSAIIPSKKVMDNGILLFTDEEKKYDVRLFSDTIVAYNENLAANWEVDNNGTYTFYGDFDYDTSRSTIVLGSFRCKLIDIGSVRPYRLVHHYSTADSLHCSSSNDISVSLYRDTVRSVKIISDSIFAEIQSCDIRVLEMAPPYYRGVFTLDMSNSRLPDTIILKNARFTSPPDFNAFNIFSLKEARTCKLFLQGVDITDWDINYRYFNVLLHLNKDTLTYTQVSNIYTQLMSIQDKHGYQDGYQKLDIEFKIYNYKRQHSLYADMLNWIDENWWGYGYKKYLIVRNAIILLVIFSLINACMFRKILHEVYPISEVVDAYDRIEAKSKQSNAPGKAVLILRGKTYLSKLAYCFIYTGYIFWGWSLDFDTLKLRHVLLAFWIIFQYLVGIVCLAYLGNYILSN